MDTAARAHCQRGAEKKDEVRSEYSYKVCMGGINLNPIEKN